MSASVLRIRAAVRMQPAGSLPITQPLRAGWGPVIFFKDRYYPGRVLECEKPIEPGQTGEAVIGMIITEPESIGLQENSTFELRDGPENVIATATVLNYSVG